MPSRDIWSHGSGTALQDLLASALGSLLMQGPDSRPSYFSSPWMSDFPLFHNEYSEFSVLLPELSDQLEIKFSEFLGRLSEDRPVRIITVHTQTSEAFASNPLWQTCTNVEFRYAPDEYHEKGILTPSFYLEGSMNLTYSGVYVREEKVTYHADRDDLSRISRAYLEFDRRWEGLS